MGSLIKGSINLNKLPKKNLSKAKTERTMIYHLVNDETGHSVTTAASSAHKRRA